MELVIKRFIMERFELHIEAESRIRWKVYVRFGGEFSKTDHSNMARRRLLSLQSNGWKVGKNPMKSWRAALVTWQKRNANASTAPQFNPQTPNFNGQGFTKTLAEQRRDRNNEECADFFARKMAEINAREMARREGAAGAL